MCVCVQNKTSMEVLARQNTLAVNPDHRNFRFLSRSARRSGGSPTPVLTFAQTDRRGSRDIRGPTPSCTFYTVFSCAWNFVSGMPEDLAN